MKKIVLILFLGIMSYYGYKLFNKFTRKATYDCELLELNYCKEKFPLGISVTDFNEISSDIILIQDYLNPLDDSNFILNAENVLKHCPHSNYMYCGIDFTFENNLLVEVREGHPCH